MARLCIQPQLRNFGFHRGNARPGLWINLQNEFDQLLGLGLSSVLGRWESDLAGHGGGGGTIEGGISIKHRIQCAPEGPYVDLF